MDDAPSFSIEITQLPKLDRTYDYKKPGWVENRSKNIHDQAYMKKFKKIAISTPKVKAVKTLQKRGRKVAPTISRPTLPQNMNYVMKTIPAHSLRFNATYNTSFANDLTLSIVMEGMELFRKTILAYT